MPEQEPNPEACSEVPYERSIQQTQELPHTPLEIAAFSIGWLLIGLVLIPSVYDWLVNPGFDPESITLIIIFVAMFGGMQYSLWRRKILQQFDFFPFGLTVFFGLVMTIMLPVTVLEDYGAFTLTDIGLEAGGCYLFLWSLVPVLEKRKNKKGELFSRSSIFRINDRLSQHPMAPPLGELAKIFDF